MCRSRARPHGESSQPAQARDEGVRPGPGSKRAWHMPRQEQTLPSAGSRKCCHMSRPAGVAPGGWGGGSVRSLEWQGHRHGAQNSANPSIHTCLRLHDEQSCAEQAEQDPAAPWPGPVAHFRNSRSALARQAAPGAGFRHGLTEQRRGCRVPCTSRLWAAQVVLGGIRVRFATRARMGLAPGWASSGGL